METKTEIKLLCICKDIWCQKYLKPLQLSNYAYHIELLENNLDKIKNRLQHNSYDILIIDYSYIKHIIKDSDLFLFNKLAFAMSRPSIIVSSSIFSYYYLQFALLHAIWLTKFKSAKDFVHLVKLSELNTITDIINTSKVYHLQLNKISTEIYNVFINQ